MIQVTVREMRKDDIEEIKQIYALYWPEEDFRNRLISRVEDFFKKTSEIIPQEFSYFVADLNSDVVGVAGVRNVPDHMRSFTVTDNPAELYIIATKILQNGIGSTLMNKVIDYAREKKYTELVLYSGETHSQYWSFYDKIGFNRVQESIAPNGEKGMIWTKILA